MSKLIDEKRSDNVFIFDKVHYTQHDPGLATHGINQV
jgi:hypothetical protein